jgi:small multidrug resistance pump
LPGVSGHGAVICQSVELIQRAQVVRLRFDMHWFYLILAILSEVAGTTCMKLSAGFTKPAPSVLMWLFYGVCFFFLTLTLKKVEVSVAYAIWSGVGTALIATVGVLYFREPVTVLKAVGILAIIGGVAALNLSGGTH